GRRHHGEDPRRPEHQRHVDCQRPEPPCRPGRRHRPPAGMRTLVQRDRVRPRLPRCPRRRGSCVAGRVCKPRAQELAPSLAFGFARLVVNGVESLCAAMYHLRLRSITTTWGVIMTTTGVNNGVNVQALLDAREALKGAPEAAKFTW